ncbi:ABC transporter permease [Bacteroidia bacterium]|nr:ABC transporter permease [Bacteroidia bacterium]
MIKHYLTVAFRNMRKYKTQTLISIVGLAVGFTCFALSALWISYEMSYDNFHRDAERIYCVYKPNIFTPSGVSRSSNFRLPACLKEMYPEIVDAAVISGYSETTVKIDGKELKARYINIDTAFFRMFDIQIIAGSRDFLIPLSNKIAITQEKAREWFGDEDPVGKELERDREKLTVCAVVAGWKHPSNYPFDFIRSLRMNYPWNTSSGEHTLIKLSSGTNVEAFKKKLYEAELKPDEFVTLKEMTLVPLTEVWYKDKNIQREVKFQHIVYFAVAGLLVILCSLFNYLTLFVSRFRIRQKEMALRRVCGASGKSLFLLLSIEFLLTLAFAFLLGLCLQYLTLSAFKQLAEIKTGTTAIYGQLSLYIAGVIFVSLLFFLLILLVFRKKTLNTAIRKGRSNFFRHASIVSQLIISVGFIFCTSVLLKQLYFLHHTSDLGFNYKNIANITVYPSDKQTLSNQLKEIPEITDVLSAAPLFPVSNRGSMGIQEWDGKPADAKPVNMEIILGFTKQYAEFYGVRLLEGEWLNDNDSTDVALINESAVKVFGWDQPLGKSFNGHIVKGVVKNICSFSPTSPVTPFYYQIKSNSFVFDSDTYPVKYKEGSYETFKAKIEHLFETEYKDAQYKHIIQAEESYDKLFQSETSLLKLLSFVSLVCIVICLFGFMSIVALSCEERRKEIAIRKINGATVKDILSIFFKENFFLLLIGSAIAFAGGYYVMQLWLEQYVLQTSIPVWIYLSIVFVMALVIVLCVGWRVWKASVENPAEVVKTE